MTNRQEQSPQPTDVQKQTDKAGPLLQLGAPVPDFEAKTTHVIEPPPSTADEAEERLQDPELDVTDWYFATRKA